MFAWLFYHVVAVVIWGYKVLFWCYMECEQDANQFKRVASLPWSGIPPPLETYGIIFFPGWCYHVAVFWRWVVTGSRRYEVVLFAWTTEIPQYQRWFHSLLFLYIGVMRAMASVWMSWKLSNFPIRDKADTMKWGWLSRQQIVEHLGIRLISCSWVLPIGSITNRGRIGKHLSTANDYCWPWYKFLDSSVLKLLIG